MFVHDLAGTLMEVQAAAETRFPIKTPDANGRISEWIKARGKTASGLEQKSLF